MEQKVQFEEVGLVELAAIWFRDWKVAVCMGLLVFLLAVVLILSISPKYDSKVNLQVSSLGEDLLVVEPAVLVAQLKATHRVGDDTQGQRLLPRLEEVTSDKRNDSPVVKLTARAHTPEAAAEFLSGLAEDVVSTHALIYQKNRKEKQALYEKLLAQKGGDGEVLDQIQKDLAVMSPTVLLSSPSIPVKPTSPKKRLLYAVSLVLGFFVMLMFPFVRVFIANVRKELQRQANQ